jgi:hypothetical protein
MVEQLAMTEQIFILYAIGFSFAIILNVLLPNSRDVILSIMEY